MDAFDYTFLFAVTLECIIFLLTGQCTITITCTANIAFQSPEKAKLFLDVARAFLAVPKEGKPYFVTQHNPNPV